MTKLYEEVNPTQYVERGIMNVDDAAVRDNINTLLTGSLMSCTLTPYIALEKVRKVLSYFHINIPAVPFMEGDRGVQVFDVHQFGNLTGMRNDGEVVTKVSQPYSIYFEYQQNEKGMFDVFCEIVTQDELEDLLDDAEDDINDEDAEDDREEKLDESIVDKAKRVLRKVSGKQQKDISSKIDAAMDKRQIELLGRKYTDSPVPITDRKKLQDDERYNSLNRRYITANYPEYRKAKVYRYLGDKKKTVKESSESVSLAGPETGEKRISGSPEKIDSIKLAAIKILKELRQYDIQGNSKIVDSGEVPLDALQKGPYRPNPNKNPRDYITNLPYTNSQNQQNKSGVQPRVPGTPAPALKSGEMSIHSNSSEPYKVSPSKFSSIQEPKSMSSQEMKAGGYQEKIQETSHETVNHVRRLAMKNSKKKV